MQLNCLNSSIRLMALYLIYYFPPQHPTLPIYGSHFTIGHGAHHDLRLGESSAATPVCRLKQAKVL